MTPDIHALEGRGFTALDDKFLAKAMPLAVDYLIEHHNQTS
ncbi:hypothetical protein ACTXPE_13100 [Psychrobacter celer]